MLTAMFCTGMLAAGAGATPRGANLLDGGAPFYDTYRTADGGYMAVGALEPQFYAELLSGLGLADATCPTSTTGRGWPELRGRDRRAVRAAAPATSGPSVFAGTDACVAPVLALGEAPAHPHNAARGTFVEVDGVRQPAPAPRFSRTPTAVPGPAGDPEPVEAILSSWR